MCVFTRAVHDPPDTATARSDIPARSWRITGSLFAVFVFLFAACGNPANTTQDPSSQPPINIDDSNLGSLAALLAGRGGSSAKPVPVTENIQLNAENWEAILTALASAGKYVNLDLSACTPSPSASGKGLRSGGTFDPRSNTDNSGAAKIVSLVLPGAATSIVDGSDTFGPDSLGGAFNSFGLLKSVSGGGIKTIGSIAFRGCTALETAAFPLAEDIGGSAFQGCTGLKTVNIPRLVTIGHSAFVSCTSLKEAGFPAVTSIGDYAFRFSALEEADFPLAEGIGSSSFQDCDALKAANFPQAERIGDNAFSGCTALITANFPLAERISNSAFRDTGGIPFTITLPQAAPEITLSTWASDSYEKTVTIRTPSSRSGYGETWQAAFKTAFGPNAGITLEFAELTEPGGQ
ncbi:MAG: leucine-rich repeat domain-containing protein [Treponema sp.]|jgi:hypothetical protein|nr:leucine-rich repeat domain-containing protein [Treponema sp.]